MTETNQAAAAELSALLKAAETAHQRMAADPTTANITAYTTANAALEKARNKAANAAPVFPRLKDACDYLTSQGFKCGDSKLSADTKKGKIARNAAGHYTKEALDAYTSHCEPLAGNAIDDNIDAISKRKLKAEMQITEVKARLAAMEEAVENKKLIPPEEAFLIIAGLFAQFRADIDSFIYGSVPESVHICDGDEKKTPDVMEFWIKAKAQWMNNFFKAWKNKQPLVVPVSAIKKAMNDLSEAL